MELYQVLGKYLTSTEHPFDQGLLGLYWDYRDPNENQRTVASSRNGANIWHQDNFGGPPWLLVWANVYPTEILLPDGQIISSEPYDIVLLDNHELRHRTPRDYLRKVRNGEPVKPRHFARCNFEIRDELGNTITDECALQANFDEWKKKLTSIENARLLSDGFSQKIRRLFDGFCNVNTSIN